MRFDTGLVYNYGLCFNLCVQRVNSVHDFNYFLSFVNFVLFLSASLHDATNGLTYEDMIRVGTADHSRIGTADHSRIGTASPTKGNLLIEIVTNGIIVYV